VAIIYKYSGGTRTKTVSGQNAPSGKTITTTKDISTKDVESSSKPKIKITKTKQTQPSKETTVPAVQDKPEGLQEKNIKFNPKAKTITSRATGEVLFSNVSAMVTKGGEVTQIQQTKEYAGPRGKERVTFTPEGEVLSEEKKGVYASHETNKIFIDGKEADLLKTADYQRVKEAGISVNIPEEAKPYAEWYAAEVEREARLKGALPFASQLESEYGDYLQLSRAPGGGYQVSILEGVSDSFAPVLGRAVDYYSDIFSYSELEPTERGYVFTDKPLNEKEYLMSKEFGGNYVSSIGTTDEMEVEIGLSSGETKAFAELTESQKEAFLTAYAPELEALRQDVGTEILTARATETGEGESFETGVELVREGDKLFYDYDKGLLTFVSSETELVAQDPGLKHQATSTLNNLPSDTELSKLETRISGWDKQIDDVIESGWGEGWEDRQVVSKEQLKAGMGLAPGIGTMASPFVDHIPDEALETMEFAIKTNIDFAAKGGARAGEMFLTASQGAKELLLDPESATDLHSPSWEKFRAPMDLTRKHPTETLLVAGSVLLPAVGGIVGGAVAGESAIIGETLLSSSAARAIGGQAISLAGRSAIPVALSAALTQQELERGYSLPEAIGRGAGTILLAEGAIALARGLPKTTEPKPTIKEPFEKPKTPEIREIRELQENVGISEAEAQSIFEVGKQGKTTEVLSETSAAEVYAREGLFKELQSAVELKPETAKETISKFPKEFLEVPKESTKVSRAEAQSIIETGRETSSLPKDFTQLEGFEAPESTKVSRAEARSLLEIYSERPTQQTLIEDPGLRPPDISEIFSKETLKPEQGFSRFEEVPTMRETTGPETFFELKKTTKPKEPEGFSRFEEVPTILDASDFVELRPTKKSVSASELFKETPEPTKGGTREVGKGTIQLELTKTKEPTKVKTSDFLELKETEIVESRSQSGAEFLKDLNKGKYKTKETQRSFFGPQPQEESEITKNLMKQFEETTPKIKIKETTKILSPPKAKVEMGVKPKTDLVPLTIQPVALQQSTAVNPIQKTATLPKTLLKTTPIEATRDLTLGRSRAKPKPKPKITEPRIDYLFFEGKGPKKKKKKKKKEIKKSKKATTGEGIYADLLSVAKTELEVGVGKARHPRLTKRPQLRNQLMSRRTPTAQMLEGKIKKSETFKIPKAIKNFGKKKQKPKKRRKK